MDNQPSITQAALSRKQVRTSLASLNLNIWLRAVCDNICGGNTFVFVAFALALGVKREHVGYLSSALGFACILQVVSLLLSRRAADKKRYVLALAYVEPFVLIGAVLLVPLLPDRIKLVALIVAMFAAAGLLHLTKPFTDEWSASTIPAGLRGRYLGRRLQTLTIVQIVAIVVIGYLAERVPEGSAGGYSLIMAVGGLFGLLAVLPLRRVSLPALSAESRISLPELKGVLSFRPFRRYVLGIIIYCSPFLLAIPYYQVVHLDVLDLPKSRIAMMQASYFLAKILVSPYVGRWTDRIGPRRMMLAVAPIYVIFFGLYVVVHPGLAWPLFVAWTLVGMADGCYFVAVTSAMYSSIPNDRTRSAYFAMMNLLTLGAYAVGALVAVPIVTWFGAFSWLRPWHLGQFQAYYLLAVVMMIAGTAGAMLVPATGRHSTTNPSPET